MDKAITKPYDNKDVIVTVAPKGFCVSIGAWQRYTDKLSSINDIIKACNALKGEEE
jgi:hypothetical protein